MGVHRITSLLHKQGWIPTSNDSSSEVESACQLWKPWNPSLSFLHQGLPMEQIPSNATILIDGNGLAFFLFKVAYARYLQSLFPSCQDSSFPRTRSLPPSDWNKALPCMMPLNRLEDVTREFILFLSNQKIKIFWDGPYRRFKTVTTQKRQRQRQEEWANLQQYSEHGSVPNVSNLLEFLRHFPVPSLFLQCVRKTLHQEHAVDMIYCQEEADVELALQASGNVNAYVMGQDSDFYFYKDIQYISFDCLFAANNNDAIHACVGRRKDLATLLGIQDQEMTELAILLGNDYIQSIKVPKKKGVDQGDPLTVVSYLHEQEDGFQVVSKDYEIELAFVRALYNLHNLDGFPLQQISDIGRVESNEDEEMTRHLKIQLPSGLAEFVDHTLAMQEDLTLTETVLGCLSFCCMDQSNVDESATLELKHLEAYEDLMTPTFLPPGQLERPPKWDNVRAAYLVERCIAVILRSPRASLLVRLTPPSLLFSHYKFHCILASKEVDETSYDSPPEDSKEEEEEPVFVERKVLPIDEHEEQIIHNIANHRVTIIHGETGCGKSSRVPVMLLNAPSPEPTLPRVKFFISQPRR